MSERTRDGLLPESAHQPLQARLVLRDSGRLLTQRRVIDLKLHATARCR